MRFRPKHGRGHRRPQASISQTGPGGFTPSWAGPNGAAYPITPDSTQRGWRPELDKDAATLISRYRHRAMLSDARYVFGGLGQVSGAIRDKANFVVGSAWVPTYKGQNRKFRDAFNEIIPRWMRNCDVRGAPYNWQSNLWLGSVCLDRDGEFFVLTVESELGSPRLQFLEAHRFGGEGVEGKVPKEAGSFVGYRVCNGIVYDAQMRTVAYNLLPPDQPWSYLSNVWNLIPARSVIHVFDPHWFSQNRGIPTICNGILDWYDIGEIRDAEKIGVKAASRVALLEYNETGKPDLTRAALDARSTADPSKIQVNHTIMESGLIRYFKAQSGNKLEAFSASRPGSTWQGFVEHISRSAHRGMDWPYEMHDWSKVGGAAIRAVVGQVQRTIRARQDVLWQPMMSAVLYAVSYYMKRGDLPIVDDWMNVSFGLPPQFSVDVGRDSNNRRQDVAMGLRGLDDILDEEGDSDVETVFRRRAEVWKKREEVANQYGVPPEALFNPGSASQPALMSMQEPVEPDALPQSQE